MSQKILLVGPKIQSTSSLGGAVVSFDALTRYVVAHSVDYSVVYVNQHQESRVLSYIKTVAGVVSHLSTTDIAMLNFSPAGLKYLGPVLYLILRLAGKKVVLRMFGGDLDRVYMGSNWLLKRLLRLTILRSDINYLQTKYLMNFFTQIGLQNIKWLPTSRTKAEDLSTDTSYRKRYIYVGQIKEEKGIRIIHEAFTHLGEEYSIDYFGPVHDQALRADIGVNYKGMLKPENVRSTLAQYDLFCFPTFWPGEGYPGVIIESYSVGLPVIASRWLAIPELIADGESGCLVSPHDVDDLKMSVQSIEESDYLRMRAGATRQFSTFDSEVVNARIIKEMTDLCAG